VHNAALRAQKPSGGEQLNAVEIEEAISQLAEQPFDATNFPYVFLEAFGNKETTIKRLRAGASNRSDLGGVLQTNNIHILACGVGHVTKALTALKDSPATAKAKAKFILATDGIDFEAEDLATGGTVACTYRDFPDHFGFFLPLAGISTVRQIMENAFDIRATSRLNRLYVTLLQDNPAWGEAERRHDMNHFMARLIFCFFAEDTGIFQKTQFTGTVEQMSERDSSNLHDVISTLFLAMNTKKGADRTAAKIPRWADALPYVNGGLFSGRADVPRFSKIARSYFLHIGNLDWTKINPDIFGSMIQAVADDEEREALGMHYTSVPNILKVLNPLFLDDLREQLKAAGVNARALLNLRKRISKIRVFDPACGSGNFLVIAYKEMRAIEVEINNRRDEPTRPSDIPLTNFRGIELRDFPAEIARLALIIAEFQCNVLYRGASAALDVFLPLKDQNWITCGNALRIDWLSICPPTGTGVKFQGDDLFSKPLDQAEIDFENAGGETYICGNPPYYGSRRQEEQQKSDLKILASHLISKWKSLDYVSGWLLKAANYTNSENCRFAFVCTSSIAEGLQVSLLWPHILDNDREIFFAHHPFKWSNLAKRNAGVSVVIVGVKSVRDKTPSRIYDGDNVRIVDRINPYLVPAPTVYVATRPTPLSDLPRMVMGSMPRDGGNLVLNQDEGDRLMASAPYSAEWLRRYVGSAEIIKGIPRYCLWLSDIDVPKARQVDEIVKRLEAVTAMRQGSPLASTKEFSSRPHRFVYLAGESHTTTVAVGGVSSERRRYLPVDMFHPRTIVSNLAFAIYDGVAWNVALIASRLHMIWIAAVCGKMKTDFRYSNTLGWNTFPVPTLTEKNKTDLTRCAEDILLAREAHFPATIGDLYDPDTTPEGLRHAHERNDEVLERIYIGRRFKNDTERLEKLFDLYTKMIVSATPTRKQSRQVSA
jgi:hypothetical protein